LNRGNKGKILIAEDNDTIRKLLSKLLTSNGYELVAVDNGLDARKKLIGENFDMLLSDILMPGIDGIELLKEVKTNFGDIPVVLITGHQSIETAKDAIHWGAFDYITKPFNDLNFVLHAIKRAVSKSKLQQEKESLISELDKKNLHLKNVVRELDRKNARLDLLVYDLEWAMKLGHIITSDINVSETVEKLNEGIFEIFDAISWGVLFYNEKKSSLKIFKTCPAPASLEKNLIDMVIRDFNRLSELKLYRETLEVNVLEKIITKTPRGLMQNHYRSAPFQSGGNLYGLIFVFADIKARFERSKQHTLSLLASQLAAAVENTRLFETIKERNQKLKELSDYKDEILSIAAHDLRSPLSAIHMSAVLLNSYSDKMNEKEKKESLEGIVTRAKHMIGMLNEMLDISVIESGKLILKKKRTDLSRILRTKFHEVTPYARSKNIELLYEVPEELPGVVIDESKMGEVLDNLLTNAIKYTPSGGKVKLRVIQEDHTIQVCVEDNGVGIKKSEQQKLFKKFSRTSAKPTAGESSTGLGLAIAKKIIELHEGDIWVESQKGVGSKFYFTVPVENDLSAGTDPSIAKTSGQDQE